MKHDYIETHLAKHEYIEGREALERFKTLMSQALQTQKSSTPFAKPKATKKAVSKGAPKKQASRRKHGKAEG
jgi:hypothetical protein